MSTFLSIDPVLFHNILGTGINVYWYGLLITTAVLAGIILATRDCKRKGYNSDLPLDLALIAVIFAVIGARLYYIIFDTTGFFKVGSFGERLMNMISIWDGGLAIYGAIIGALIAVFVFSKFNKKYTFIQLLDMGAAPLALGQAIGRWGNFFNQEAFGNEVTNKGLQWFPYAVNLDAPKGNFSPGWFQATFFYESIWCLGIAIFVYWFFKRQKYNGQAIILYFTLYGFERALVELLRTDSLLIPHTTIRVSSLLSAIVFVIGVAMLLYFSKNPPQKLLRANASDNQVVPEGQETEARAVKSFEKDEFEDMDKSNNIKVKRPNLPEDEDAE